MPTLQQIEIENTVYDLKDENLKNTLEYTTDKLDTTDFVRSLGIIPGRLKDDGTVDGTATGYVTTDYIPVDVGGKYVLELPNQTSTYTVYRCTYGSSKNFLNDYVSFEAQAPTRGYDIIGQTAFVRFSISNNVYNDGFSFRLADSLIDVVADKLDAAEETLSGIDYVQKYGVISGMLQSDGSVAADNNMFTTNFIPVKPGEVYSFITPNSTSYSYWRCTYAANKNLVTYDGNVLAKGNRQSFIIPDGVAFIRMCVSSTVYGQGYKIAKKYNAISAIEETIGSLNYVTAFGIESGRLKSDGTVDTSISSYVTTDFIPVIPGMPYSLELAGYTSQYSIYRCTYDKNLNLIEYIDFEAQAPTRGYDPFYPIEYVRFSVSQTVYNEGFSFKQKYNNFNTKKNLVVNRNDFFETQTDVLPLVKKNGYVCTKLYDNIDHGIPSGKTAQAFSISNGVLFQFMAEDLCRLYDYATGETFGDIEVTCGHANSAAFSNEYYNQADEFPLVYISDTNGDVYVNRITRSGATLIKTLYFDPSAYGYYPQVALDPDSSNCYVVGSQTETVVASNPTYTVSVCDLDSLTQADGKYIPELIDRFTVTIPGSSVVLQGCNYINGHVWVTSGGGSTSVLSQISIIDVTNESLSTQLTNFPEIASIHEMEDVEFVPNPYGAKYDVILHVREYGYYKLVL